MKIIDLLNIWVNDRVKLPKKIKVNDKIFEYKEDLNLYETNNGYFLVQDYLCCAERLHNNIEVIEESEEINIQKIKPFIIPRIAPTDEKDMWADRIIINKLIESVKQLDKKINKESEEK